MKTSITKNTGLKSLPFNERPREKLKQHGSSALSESELLAIILRTGTKGIDVLSMSNYLLQQFSLKKLSRISINNLQKNLGVGEAKACQIAACFELGRRLAKFKEKITEIRKAKDVADLLMPEMKTLNKEHLRAMFLNTKQHIIKIETIFIGPLNESVIHPREIFHAALAESAAYVILTHNHPSGDPTPSSTDIEVTKQIAQAGEIVGIPVLDQIIIGDGKFISLREKQLI